MRVIDLFCGMGGFSLGFVKQDFEVFGFDKGKWQFLNYWHNVSKRVMRVNLINYTPKVKNVDVVIAGPPCEPYSRLNINSEKKYEKHPLFPTLRRTFEIISALEPKFFVIENVDKAFEFAINYLHIVDKYETKLVEFNYYNFGCALKKQRTFLFGSLDGIHEEIVKKMLNVNKKGKTLKEAILKYIEKDWDPKINHVWRRSQRNTKFQFSFVVNVKWNEPMRTFGNIDKMWVFHPILGRPLSVREAMEVYGFPLSYKFIPRTPLRTMYEMIADTVSPLFSETLAKIVRSTLQNV